jgi:acyl dehydratase
VTNDENDAEIFWKTVITSTLEKGHTGKNPLILDKHFEDNGEIPRPENTSFLSRHVGEFKFQIGDWRASFEESIEGFHAVEFDDRYECHIDMVDPKKDPIGHLVKDSIGTLVILVAVIVLLSAGGVIYYFKKKKEDDA